jgi:limonene-1,2-epoxide hydrolase
MRAELDPRDPQQLGGHATGCGNDVGHHQIGREVAQDWHVKHGHLRGAPVNPGPGVDIVVDRRKPVQLNGVNAGIPGGVDPFHPGEQSGLIAGFGEALAQRDRGKRVPGIRPGDHRDAHRPTLPQRHSRTLASMTDPTQTSPETVENIRTVEGFLNALQDEDFEAADAALDDNLVYENVGMPTIHGRHRAMTLFRRMEGRMRFEVKIHRIAADGAAVLTERSDAIIFGPLRLQFWVCGVFEVHDGRITLWRDYFDFFDMLKATLRGIAALALPSLKASF